MATTTKNERTAVGTKKSCPCVLCGKIIIAETEEDCIAHMSTCEAFLRVHPKTGGTNPNGVYPDGKGPSSWADATSPDEPVVEEASVIGSNDGDIVDVEKMTIKELKRLIASAGLSFLDCIEKEDLRIRAREAIGTRNGE